MDDNLAAISAATETIETTTPEEASKKERASLFNKYLAAQENTLTAPAAERDAERLYYTAAEGSDGYAKRVDARNATEAAQLRARLTKARAADVARLNDAMNDYATTAQYAKNLDGVVLGQLEDVIAMADTLDARTTAQTTNNRKSAFLDIERMSVARWDARLTMAIWVLAAVYAKAFVLPQPTNPLPWAVVAALIASPWLLGLVAWVVSRRIPPFNIYTTFSN